MVAQVRAIAPAEFKTWLETKKREIDESNKAALERRRPTPEAEPATRPSPTPRATPRPTRRHAEAP